MDPAAQLDDNYIYKSGMVSKTLSYGKSAADMGFYVASRSTSIGVGIARGVICTVASITGLSGNVALMGLLYGVDTTVGAAERIAQAAIFLSHTLTTYGIEAADATLEHTGAAQSIERGIWKKMKEISDVMLWQDHTDAISRIIGMVSHYTVPLTELSKSEISMCIKEYALLQQNHRLSVVFPKSIRQVPAEDLARCMGLAAASYGTLAINFLEYLPRGTYQSDILSQLAPGISAADVVLENQQESIFQPGYMLILDHAKKDIVLSIRGTLNPHDILTDLACHHTSCSEELIEYYAVNSCEIDAIDRIILFESDGATIEEEHFAHDGFLQSAQRLDLLLTPEIVRLVEKYPQYGLLLCGHSLGAGVASILTILWIKKFTTVRCVALSPPCVLTLSAARSVADRVVSVVVGDDMVARFGIGSSLDLRDACLHVHHVLSGCTDAEPDISFIETIRNEHMIHPKLYPPGMIIHIVQRNEFLAGYQSNDEQQNGDGHNNPIFLQQYKYEVAYVTDQLTFSEIQISGSMFSSHMPHNVLSTIRNLFPSNNDANSS